MKNKQQLETESECQDTGKVLTEEELNETDDKSNESSTKTSSKEQEYLEMAQRIQAEFDNYRKRNQDAVFLSRQDGIAYAIETLLPVIDSIDSAKRQIKDEAFLKSIELLHSQTLSCFEKLGAKKIKALGEHFDPTLHNAIMAEEVDGEPDIVLEEFQEGFELNGKVIRHSVVKVSKW